MDPDGNGFVSISASGFSAQGLNGYYVNEFEIPMFGIPISGSGEALGDNQAGPSCGITDITVDTKGFGVYAVVDNSNNLIFRFRIGTNNPSVEAYTILIDTDRKMGADDPNSTPNNPGFEIDITLIKNSSKGIYIFNIDGIESCPTALKNYSYNSNFQISVADVVTCNDLDYFYDYYVPFADLQSLFGITKNTELRFAALTNVSATCAMAGKISDVGGVNDNLYGGCNSCAFLVLGADQCPTSLNNLCIGCAGFQSGVTPKPIINVPVKNGENGISGTAVPGATIFVDLFNASQVLKESVTTVAASTGCTACPWTASFAGTLALGDIVSAKAKSSSGCSSGGISSDATITVVVNNIPPVASGAGGALTYQENDPPLKVDGNLLLSDADNSNLNKATVSITTNYAQGEDVLSFVAIPGVTGSFNASTGSITFVGVAPLTAYQGLLRSVAYSNTSENPSTLTRSVRIVVNDGLDNNIPFDRSINVLQVNDAPVAVDDFGTTNEDTPVIIPNIAANDSDVDGTVTPGSVDLDPLAPGKQITFTAASGSWSVNASGDVTFTPALNFNGLVTRNYAVNDNNGATSNTASITITVVSVNDPPVASNDVGSTDEDASVTLPNITSNDSDVDGTVDASTVDLDPSSPGIQASYIGADGTWTVNSAGDLTYVPALNFNGVAARTYVVRDNSGGTSNAAVITVIVNPVNDLPVAVNDNGVTNEDTPFSFPNVTTNDTDIDGTVDASTVDLDPLTTGVQAAFSNVQGSWSANAAGAVTYTPALNFNGTVTRTYTVNDNVGGTSNIALITIIVNSVNDAPVANNDSGLTDKNTPVTLFTVTGNDTDVDGSVDPNTVDLDPSTVGMQTTVAVAAGTWSVVASNVTFTPAPGYVGVASINYVVKDDLGALSNSAIITITVSNTTATGNTPPVANDDAGVTLENTPVTLSNIISNDTDADGIDASSLDLDPLTAGRQVTFTNSKGIWTVDNFGSVTYTPASNFNGTATKTYTIKDNIGTTSNVATITITVNPVNSPPIAYPISGTTNEDTPVTLPNITANDTDIDGSVDAATVDLDPSVSGKQSVISNATGNWFVDISGNLTFTPPLNYWGVVTISYTVNDNSGATSNVASITITVTAVNDPPVAVNDMGTTNEDISITLPNITSNDTDVDGSVDPASVDLDPVLAGLQATFTDTHGTWTVAPSGALTFVPAIHFTGTAKVVYTVKDNSGALSNVASVTIAVNKINSPPVASDVNGTTNEDMPITLENITSKATDVDGVVDVSSVDIDPNTNGIQPGFNGAQGLWSVNVLGNLTFKPNLNYNGVASIEYTVRDNLGATSNKAVISVTVLPVNDFPLLKNLAFPTFRNVAVNGSVFDSSDIDPDGTVLAVNNIPVNKPDHGQIVVNADGSFIYTPAADYAGNDLAEIQICDGGIPLPAACATKTIQFTVKPTNRPPKVLYKGLPANVITIAAQEDTPIVFCLETSDPDGDDVVLKSYTHISGDVGLALYDNLKSCFIFTPTKNINGKSIWEIELCDTGTPILCVKVTVTVDVTPVNDNPVAVTDTMRVLRYVSSSANVLMNDYDIENDVLKMEVKAVQDVKNGQAMLSADGNVNYVSNLTFRGIDSLQYKICDSGSPSVCSVGKVIIVVGDLPLKVYDGVSPNGDGNNDFLRIDGVDYYTENEVMIFDRFNNPVFQISGYNNEDRVWRGQANKGIGPAELPEGTYFYSITLGDGSPAMKGYLVLKRN